MGKFFQQVVLLTRKNIRVRFSHYWLCFWELGIPLLLAISVGLLQTYTRASIVRNANPLTQTDSSLEEKFNCSENQIWDSKPRYYFCEEAYENVNDEKMMNIIGTLSISYIAPDTELGHALMDNILRRDSNLTINWRRSQLTEKEWETCFLQEQLECPGAKIVVVVTTLQDGVKEKNEFKVEYKIRTGELHEENLYVNDDEGHFIVEERIEEAHASYMNSYKFDWFPMGMVYIQAFMDRGIRDFVRNKVSGNNTDNIQISLLRMPFILPRKGRGGLVSSYGTIIYVLLASLPIFSLMRVNSEKCSGFKELLRMHGVSVNTQWAAWYLSNFLVYLVWTFLMTLALSVPWFGESNVLYVYETNWVLYWLMTLLLIMSLTSFSYLVSVFFEKVWSAASVGLVIWIVLAAGMMIASSQFFTFRTGTRFGLMMIPPIAFDFTFKLFINGGGAIDTMTTTVIEDVTLTALHCLFMQLFNNVLLMTLTIYLDSVLPHKYGIRRSPLYLIQNVRHKIQRLISSRDRYSKAKSEYVAEDATVELGSFYSHENNPSFQPYPENSPVAVVIENLKKQYRRNSRPAVDGLSVKVFSGDIFVLLGFNGCGKTTTFGMLTGFTPITSGIAKIFDLDIENEMEKIRTHIGLCPQHNLLYNDMTVLDQVTFFGALQGLPDARKRACDLLLKLRLSDKLNAIPDTLSGGLKRIVHLAIALIGNPQLVFLDECTTGLDSDSRRVVWDILLKLKEDVTIILTTHNMEEADVLGDRIGIMSEGKLVCCGTPSFLKQHYGVGYNLKLNSVASRECDYEKVWNIAKNYVPTSKLNEILRSISIPTANLDMGHLADLMEVLHKEKETLGIDSIGLSLSTMDEVFLKVGESVHAVPNLNIPSENNDHYSARLFQGDLVSGIHLTWYRFVTLFQKKALLFICAPWTILLLAMFFAGILWACLHQVSLVLHGPEQEQSPRTLSGLSVNGTPNHYFTGGRRPLIFVEDSKEANFLPSYLNQLQPLLLEPPKRFPVNTTTKEIVHFLKESSLQDLHEYRKKFLVGSSLNTDNSASATGYFSAFALHSAPLSFNLLSQAILKMQLGVDTIISVVAHPFHRPYHFDFVGPWRIFELVEGFAGRSVRCAPCLVLIVISTLLVSGTTLLPTQERLNKGKHLQLMTGTSPWLYWSATFTWDFLFISVVNILITLTFWLADYTTGNWIFTNHGAGLWIYLILECHAFALLWLCYLVSMGSWLKTAVDGFITVNKVALVVGVVWSLFRIPLLRILDMIVSRNRENPFYTSIIYCFRNLTQILLVVPGHTLFQAMFKLVELSAHNSICFWIPKEILDKSCKLGEGSTNANSNAWYIYQCCENCTETAKVGSCFKPIPYGTGFFSKEAAIIKHMTLTSYEPSELEEEEQELFAVATYAWILVLSGFLFMVALIALEYIWGHVPGQQQNAPAVAVNGTTRENLDEDVQNEDARVNGIVGVSGEPVSEGAFIVHRIRLKFGSMEAVKNLSFAVNPGECFGLLGVNGAGKTSTFRVLTGEVDATSGNAWAAGYKLGEQRKEYLRSIGYCPQFDAIIGQLTGLQMVRLYGALRGIPALRLDEESKLWLDRFGLLSSAKKKCADYSLGMQRRLSTIMALIGNPKLVFLDEPTSACDPAFRRQFWKVVREIRETGQSILLTSHSMDECEALCTRLGIMVKGRLQCLGSVPHLKRKFGEGYILTINLARTSAADPESEMGKMDLFIAKILETFSPSRIHTKQKVLVQVQILDKSLWYSDIFREMETLRKLPEYRDLISEYFVTEVSLEDVFISFATKSTVSC